MNGILLLSIVSNFGTQVIEMRVFEQAYKNEHLNESEVFTVYGYPILSMSNLFMA